MPRIFVGHSPFEPMPLGRIREFEQHTSHGTLVHGHFGPEPTKITRVRNDPKIIGANRARKINKLHYLKVDRQPYGCGTDYSPWEQGHAAARHGLGRKSNPFDVHTQPDLWDEWMDGFRSE